MLKQKVQANEFVCTDSSKIFFGKFKGRCHSVLKDEENRKYCEWLMSTEEGFAEPTKEYINTYIKF